MAGLFGSIAEPIFKTMGPPRSNLSGAVRRSLVAAALVLTGVQQAQAQSTIAPADTADSGLQVLLTPYLWILWADVSVRPGDNRIPAKSTTLSPVDIYGHLKLIPFMGEAELRDGAFGLIADYIHAPLSAGVSTHGVLFSGVNAGLTINTGTAMFMYRVPIMPDQYLDVGAGLRGWGLAGSISLDQGLLPSFTVSNGLSWGDPLIGARYHCDLGNGFGATAYADVGGFGVGAHSDWQVVGTVDYAYDSQIDLHAGFRSLNFNYGAPRANIQWNLFGPFVALTYRVDGL